MFAQGASSSRRITADLPADDDMDMDAGSPDCWGTVTRTTGGLQFYKLSKDLEEFGASQENLINEDWVSASCFLIKRFKEPGSEKYQYSIKNTGNKDLSVNFDKIRPGQTFPLLHGSEINLAPDSRWGRNKQWKLIVAIFDVINTLSTSNIESYECAEIIGSYAGMGAVLTSTRPGSNNMKSRRTCRGSFGTVYKSRHSSGKYFAMKYIYADTDAKLFKAKQEAALLRKCQAANVISLINEMQKNDYYILIMELADMNLETLLANNGPLNEADAMVHFKSLAAGLKSIHDSRVTHRDLKLNNILLLDGKVKIADFGAAAEKSVDKAMKSAVCTYLYAAPETLSGTEAYTQSIDIWSAGVCLYRLLSAQYPFYAADDPTLFYLIRNAEPDLTLLQHTSAACQQLIKNMLHKDPSNRPSIDQVLSSDWLSPPIRRGKTITRAPSSAANAGAAPTPTQTPSTSTSASPFFHWSPFSLLTASAAMPTGTAATFQMTQGATAPSKKQQSYNKAISPDLRESEAELPEPGTDEWNALFN